MTSRDSSSPEGLKLNDLPQSVEPLLHYFPGLGKAKGYLLDGKVTQFNNIPYGEIPFRWASAVPVETPWIGEEIRDCQNYGPSCPQPLRRFYPIPLVERPYTNTPGDDEFKCLSLNITMPVSKPSEDLKLPVMVWIHGGGFVAGSGSAPMTDGRSLAAMSHAFNLPTIIITISYRLGVFGFMANSDIEVVNKADGREQQTANWGLHDQRLALKWIRNHISAFGGDPDKVTVFGESAGSCSIDWHLSGPALFDRAILMSGVAGLCGISTVQEYDAWWHKLTDYFGISRHVTPEQRICAMRQVPAKDMLIAHDLYDCFIPLNQICDNGDVRIYSFGQYESRKLPIWCSGIMVGDCKNEGILFNHRDRFRLSGEELIKDLQEYLGLEKSKIVVDAYKITSDLCENEGTALVEHMITHSLFSLPNYALVKANPGVFYYHFDEPSTFQFGVEDGKPARNKWINTAHHALDDKYVFNILRPLMNEKQKRTGEAMAKAWLTFANGKEPWPSASFPSQPFVQVFGPEGECRLKSLDEDEPVRKYSSMEKILQAQLLQDFCNWGEERAENRSDLLNDPWKST
ncbi:alpha/beta-hydrolase [Glonium stellatum]|uniref:Carboxylic ester hydrolase n=1 Tax=Glonium stellatum TaxID=574774 RepID=A0A8E2JYU1_9PEZI|nr:alpha/beta-hydrolase [Glonium stellatum]